MCAPACLVLQAALAELSSATGCTHSVCDVTQDNAVGAAVKEALHRFDGQLGGLVYAVGSIPIKSAKQGLPPAMVALRALHLLPCHEGTVG